MDDEPANARHSVMKSLLLDWKAICRASTGKIPRVPRQSYGAVAVGTSEVTRDVFAIRGLELPRAT